MSRPLKGVMEADCREAPVPAIGTVFNWRNGAKTHRAVVTGTGKLREPRHRRMGIVEMVATHMVEFVVENP